MFSARPFSSSPSLADTTISRGAIQCFRALVMLRQSWLPVIQWLCPVSCRSGRKRMRAGTGLGSIGLRPVVSDVSSDTTNVEKTLVSEARPPLCDVSGGAPETTAGSAVLPRTHFRLFDSQFRQHPSPAHAQFDGLTIQGHRMGGLHTQTIRKPYPIHTLPRGANGVRVTTKSEATVNRGMPGMRKTAEKKTNSYPPRWRRAHFEGRRAGFSNAAPCSETTFCIPGDEGRRMFDGVVSVDGSRKSSAPARSSPPSIRLSAGTNNLPAASGTYTQYRFAGFCNLHLHAAREARHEPSPAKERRRRGAHDSHTIGRRIGLSDEGR